ncbi:hypothetical protein LTR35_016844 [Friedmanniomyces endolithicus]|uniref:Methyltransferase domain-containing protein n=1 Tax=Friedmanniomyces endolithicus TaxID=329885 RepID=A0AAN6J4G3_9PEZI|nr:hypothetical protein LTR35_016844 [Friedmanniomyces endolithicus]KAK0272664.1 hypothetical protein LTS00_016112 [Friedmanniomyces endolithicus]KAK0315957.1 hypothetical protein LTR82_012493 [Friedmanniomyces endolithicus]KAK0976406.1 hypothetical protein LTR54_016516 [Friedmanniomyces endolithicus]KAK1067915.1 hypothetical protein LTR74_006007 [Friedmanniomyces endolithicus]
MRRALLHRRHVASSLRRVYTARTAPRPPRQTRRPQPVEPASLVGKPSSANKSPAAPPSSFAPWIFGALAAGLGFYSLQLYLAASQPCHNTRIADLAAQKDVAERYDYTAASFDSEVGLSELLMGVNGLRKKLAQKCHGEVLEVSCGTGRNLGYYDIGGGDAKVESLGFIDLSPQMVEVCQKKWATLFGNKMAQQKLKPGLKLRFMTGSALGDMPLAPNGKKYDTIVQTMGLCSTAEPAELLANMARHLDTSNPDARILLLEHGRSYLPWLNRVLDNSAEKHAELHGCWFNREIGELVEKAALQSGLEVVSERRHHLGTTWVFELKPTDGAVKKAQAGLPLAATQQTEKGQ